MPNSFADDPHSQDGSACPANFFGLRAFDELKAAESKYVVARSSELLFRPMHGVLDAQYLSNIHAHLFQDVFPWAGKWRVVDIAKTGGTMFAHHAFIQPALQTLFARLPHEQFLTGLSHARFAERAAEYLGEINAVHPFREGNGRTQREFIRVLALRAGHPLLWSALNESENTIASVESHIRGNHTGLERIILEAIRQYEVATTK